MSRSMEGKFLATEMDFLRRSARNSKLEKVRNEEIKKISKKEITIIEEIQKKNKGRRKATKEYNEMDPNCKKKTRKTPRDMLDMKSLKQVEFGLTIVLVLLIIEQCECRIENSLEDYSEFDGKDEREGKQYWPVIGLVRFENSNCSSLEGYEGVCVTRRECGYIGGIQSGSCTSNGIGRCCLLYRTCGQSSAYNNTYFVSDDYPNTFNDETSCTFTIEPCPGTSCQARVDFLNFVLSQPDGNGNCIYDSMVITGSGGNIPVICGENSGQHIYLTFVGNNSITITISTSSSVDLERSFNLKVTQIACDCPTLAPPGCLQYYTDLSATVRSFNYGTQINGAVITYANSTTVAGTRQLANTNYGVCIQMQPGYCSIQWAQSSDSTSFTVTNNTALVEVVSGLPNDPIVGSLCTTDFVVIPNPYYSNDTAVNSDRFCGNEFATVYTYSKPFVLTVITDADELQSEDVANRGFSLTFTQQSCRNVNPVVLLTG
ncbi:uncharacterized protein LOC115889828 [Sitophilus oryzae]|uniref:Uncharacterized protein LOC115889828 n=1 Tax=Sitophilus oryzae TaxID=7048 RepID=A0A6J2YR56_SITOR|nr:uncharacterized protein LOC115889828 [Sitophilus oryzae]